MLKLGLIGMPVSQSLSPLIHDDFMKQAGLAGNYELIEVAKEALVESVDKLAMNGYAGLNVTIPHKQKIFDICVSHDKFSNKMKAVNTLKNIDGKWAGFNTDGAGYLLALQNFCEQNNRTDFFQNIFRKRIVILGAGGAARGIYFALRDAGVENILICNRTMLRAQNIIDDDAGNNKARFVEWDKRSEILQDCDLLIHTTSLGMIGQDELDIAIDELPSDAIVSDIVYKPRMTKLLRDAQKRNIAYMDGVGMLCYQAALAFEIWTGFRPVVSNDLMDLIAGRANG
jgi:shikimate dehydrogenase